MAYRYKSFDSFAIPWARPPHHTVLPWAKERARPKHGEKQQAGPRTLGDELATMRDREHDATKHARVPYSVTVKSLGLASTHARELHHTPRFQAVFHHRQGAEKTETIGAAPLNKI